LIGPGSGPQYPSNQAVGEAETGDADPKLEDFCAFGAQRVCKAFIWQHGVMSALPLLKDSTGVAGHNAVAKGINILGQVVHPLADETGLALMGRAGKTKRAKRGSGY
jgi:hypothetical protein